MSVPSPKILLCWWRGLWSSLLVGLPISGHVYGHDGQEATCVTCGKIDREEESRNEPSAY